MFNGKTKSDSAVTFFQNRSLVDVGCKCMVGCGGLMYLLHFSKINGLLISAALLPVFEASTCITVCWDRAFASKLFWEDIQAHAVGY